MNEPACRRRRRAGRTARRGGAGRTQRGCGYRRRCPPAAPTAWREQVIRSIAALGREDILRVLTAS